jgi:hypothetical protein
MNCGEVFRVSLEFSSIEIVLIFISDCSEISLIWMPFNFFFLQHIYNVLSWVIICLNSQFTVVWNHNDNLNDIIYYCQGILVIENDHCGEANNPNLCKFQNPSISVLSCTFQILMIYNFGGERNWYCNTGFTFSQLLDASFCVVHHLA